MTAKLQKCDEATIAGRLRKAEQFMEGAETIREFAGDEGDIGEDTRRIQPPTSQHPRAQAGRASSRTTTANRTPTPHQRITPRPRDIDDVRRRTLRS
jgi:hypothetical protein